MATVDVQSPNGEILTVEVPDGATDAQIEQFVASQYQPQPREQATEPNDGGGFDWWQDLGEDIAYPAIGAALGAVSPIPGGAAIGTFLGELAAQDGDSFTENLKGAGINTAVDLFGGKLLQKGAKLPVVRDFVNKADDAALAFRELPPTRVGEAVRDAFTVGATPAAREGVDAISRLAGRDGSIPGNVIPGDAEAVARPMADQLAGFPKNSVEHSIMQLERNAAPGSKARRRYESDAELRRMAVQQGQADLFPAGHLKVDYGVQVNQHLDNLANELKKTDEQVWDLIQHAGWTASPAAARRASDGVNDVLRESGLRDFLGDTFKTGSDSSLRNAAIDLDTLAKSLGTGNMSSGDIEQLRRMIGAEASRTHDKALWRAYYGLRDVQTSLIQDAKIPGYDETLAVEWRKNQAKWAAYKNVQDIQEDLAKGNANAAFNKLVGNPQKLDGFWQVSTPEMRQQFVHTVAFDLVDSGASLNATQKAYKKLPQTLRDKLDGDYGTGKVMDNVYGVASLKEWANSIESEALRATSNVGSFRPRQLVQDLMIAHFVRNNARDAYEIALKIAPQLQQFGRGVAKSSAARKFIDQFVTTGAVATAREAGQGALGAVADFPGTTYETTQP